MLLDSGDVKDHFIVIALSAIMSFKYISVEQKKPGVFVITLQKPPENRLNVAACQELIRAYHEIVC